MKTTSGKVVPKVGDKIKAYNVVSKKKCMGVVSKIKVVSNKKGQKKIIAIAKCARSHNKVARIIGNKS